jgi:ATP-dependent DNA helicase RecG
MAKKKYAPLELMKMAIEESHKSIPEHTDKTDPLVGAIITTKDGEILAKAHRGELREGAHCEYTLIERKLFNLNLKNCVLYVTLEPCTDESRNNDKNKIKTKRGCATHIVKARITTVYVGIEDPNPKISTDGIQFLESKGITVQMFPQELGVEIRKDNAQFIKEKEKEALQAKLEAVKPKLTVLQQAAPGTTIANFSDNAILKFISSSSAPFSYPSAEFNEWAYQFGFLEKEEGDYKPTGLGIMLFGKNPENQFPQTVFKVEINYGKGKPEIRDFKGPLVTQLPEVIDFIKDKGLKFTMDKSSGSRKEVADFPFEVLLEAVANAVIHRDYTIAGATNYLYIDPEKIIVRSPGNPFLPITLDDLKKCDAPSLSRNPKIMYVFNQMHLAEQRGIGLRNMKRLPQEGFPLPAFEMKAGMLEITFGRTKEFIAKKAGLKNLSKLSEEDKNGYLFIQQKGELSRGEFASKFSLNDKAAQRRLAKLVEMKLIVMTGDKKGARYKVKA